MLSALLLSLLPLVPVQAGQAGQTGQHGQDEVLVFRGARIETAAGPAIPSGDLVIKGGKVVAVGKTGEVEVPRGARQVDCRGRVIVPGLVDTHSHLGVYSIPSVRANSDGNEMTGPIQGIVRAEDSINPADPAIRMALAGGITTANIMPGSGNVIGGQTAYVKLRGATVEDMLLEVDQGPGKGLHGGLKMANGENPKRVYGSRHQSPVTRMGLQALARARFVMARNYRDKWARWRDAQARGDASVEKPERDLGLDPIVEALDGKRIVHHHTHRADDLLRAVALAEEFGFRIVLHHVSEGYKVADILARKKIPCSVIVIDSPGGKLEAADYDLRCAGALEKAGVEVCLHTDDPITSSRFFMRSAALAVRAGMSRDGALRALTIEGARMLDLDDRIGSLEPGKDADFVVLSGDPFSVSTKVIETWIDGRLVWYIGDLDDRLHLTGGFAVAHRYPTLGELPARPQLAVEPPIVGGTTPPLVIKARLLHTMGGMGTIKDAVVFVQDGKVQAVGRLGALELAEGTRVLEAEVVTPGLIDARGVAGLTGIYNVGADQDHHEDSGPVQARLRAIDGFNPREKLLGYLLSFGVTAVQSGPSPTNVIAGECGVFKTYGDTVADCTLRFPSAMAFTLGEMPKEEYGERHLAPSTRMGTAAVIRKTLNEARELMARLERKPDEVGGKERERLLELEPLFPVLRGELPALFTAHREDDVLTALRLTREFSLRTVLDAATEGYLVRDVVAAAGVPVIASPAMLRLSGLERFNASLEGAALLVEKGVRVAIGSGFEGYVPKTRVVLFEAAVASAYGLGEEEALRAVTIEAARILGVDDRIGSIEVGKDADLVLFGGPPFEYVSQVDKVVVNGKVVHERR
ncbi:MAG: amidohydrolase family protein [Planctomycetota bacterium]